MSRRDREGNDQVRFELTYMALHPQIKIIAPLAGVVHAFAPGLIEYAEKHGIPVTATKANGSMDMNLFHTSYEGGILEDPWQAPPEEIFVMSVSPGGAPAKARKWRSTMSPVTRSQWMEKDEAGCLAGHLNTLGGEHGVGRVDLVENRYVGMKSRGVYETPGGTILHTAHRGPGVSDDGPGSAALA